ncbi:MAG: hypothetical protein Q8862_03230 [Bacteroidota bacterium]|nr:hypothetical protein [Bacteroidota bacterium]MDP4206131.1 hypothetical protein [Bacteroidota bacterium]
MEESSRTDPGGIQKYSVKESKGQTALIMSREKANRLFSLGLILYALAYILLGNNSLNSTVCRAFQLAGLLLIIFPGAWMLKIKSINNYLKVILILWFIWQLFIISRGITELGTQSWYINFLNPMDGVLNYFVPVLIFWPQEINDLKKIFHTTVAMGIGFLILCLIFYEKVLDFENRDTIEYYVLLLSFPSGFMLLTLNYHSRRRKFFTIAIILITFILATYKARRNLMLSYANIMLAGYLLHYLYFNNQKIKHRIRMVAAGVLIFMTGLLIFNQTKDKFFNYTIERISQDTRSDVEESFFEDMSRMDMVIGKGLNGSYFYPMIDEGTEEWTDYRSGIETGYLNILLKGGGINLILILLMILPAIGKGLFQSKNGLAKAAAIQLMLWLLDLYPTAGITFSLRYFLIWICVGICYSPYFLNLSDKEIYEAIQAPDPHISL